mmetsp:Transcript_118135/g.376646  ORF Transcript_118135/g.376646 Transcript_118135/m.376646 type:complete len:211 (-) Transcript_118135:138-770(-)
MLLRDHHLVLPLPRTGIRHDGLRPDAWPADVRRWPDARRRHGRPDVRRWRWYDGRADGRWHDGRAHDGRRNGRPDVRRRRADVRPDALRSRGPDGGRSSRGLGRHGRGGDDGRRWPAEQWMGRRFLLSLESSVIAASPRSGVPQSMGRHPNGLGGPTPWGGLPVEWGTSVHVEALPCACVARASRQPAGYRFHCPMPLPKRLDSGNSATA